MQNLTFSLPFSYPPAPTGWVFYAIGDIHGRQDLLLKTLALIDKDKKKRGERDRCAEIFLGDLIDRGANSCGVLELLTKRQLEQEVVLIRANHEIAMLNFMNGLIPFERWKAIGGVETLLSYNIAPSYIRQGGEALRRALSAAIPAEHIEFITQSEDYVDIGNYCFVHAGIRPNIPLEKQRIEDLSFIRRDFLDYKGDFGKIIIHGHSPVLQPDFRKNRINIDTGAYLSGLLTVLVVDEKGVSILL